MGRVPRGMAYRMACWVLGWRGASDGRCCVLIVVDALSRHT